MLFRRKTRIVVVIGLVFLLISTKILLNPSSRLISSLSSYICPEARYFFNINQPLIALTIDDSPDDNDFAPNTTLEILKVLAQYQVKATFFIITNKAQGNPQIIKNILKQGHELGNHLTKDESSIKLGDRFETEFKQADHFLTQFTSVNWFRPGHGWCNTQMTEIVKKYNYQIVLGSVWSYDTILPFSWFSSWYIQRNIRPSSIIILHDSGERNNLRGKNTLKTLNLIIPQLQQQGYHFVTLSELNRFAVSF
jgi:peptidoglycan-N-acetylglucosamine deacetylase